MTRILALLLLASACLAKNVDLVTLPNRESVQLTIYNSEDLTLVKETRHITLKRGVNQLQFSWANTLIDPSSVEFRPLEHKDSIEIADTTFPGRKPQHLIWNIVSEINGEVAVEVSYFTSGLTWSMDYVALTDPDETRMDFTGYVRVFNHSGEEYENAQVRLIVGKINLVEKIAELARRQGIPMPAPTEKRFRTLQGKAGRKAFARAEAAARDAAKEAKKIVKEGVAEYFMFTVEGQETVRNGWSKRMRAVKAKNAGFRIVYRLREHQYGPRPVRFFLWKNDAAHELGDSPLPDGRIRVFRRNTKDGMSFLGEQLVRYVPIKAKIEVNLGPDDLVVYDRRRTATIRNNFVHHNKHEYVVGWDERTDWVDRISNFRGKPITFELHRIWPGDVDFSSEIDSKLFDYRTVQATFQVGAGAKVLYPHRILTRHGTNRKQNRIALR
ncbi:MAG: hypothetical protein ACYTHK_18030 [Planctomycetota bacterium]|jgi:hypothetical protein